MALLPAVKRLSKASSCAAIVSAVPFDDWTIFFEAPGSAVVQLGFGRADVEILRCAPRLQSAPSERALRKIASGISWLIGGGRGLRDPQQGLSLHLGRNRHSGRFEDGGRHVQKPDSAGNAFSR